MILQEIYSENDVPNSIRIVHAQFYRGHHKNILVSFSGHIVHTISNQ